MRLVIAVVLSLAIGCGKATRNSTTPPNLGGADSSKAIEVWKQLVASVRAREASANERFNTVKRIGDSTYYFDERFTYKSDDVKKSDSAITPLLGELVYIHSTKLEIPEDEQHRSHSYELRFQYSWDGSQWTFHRGFQTLTEAKEATLYISKDHVTVGENMRAKDADPELNVEKPLPLDKLPKETHLRYLIFGTEPPPTNPN